VFLLFDCLVSMFFTFEQVNFVLNSVGCLLIKYTNKLDNYKNILYQVW